MIVTIGILELKGGGGRECRPVRKKAFRVGGGGWHAPQRFGFPTITKNIRLFAHVGDY